MPAGAASALMPRPGALALALAAALLSLAVALPLAAADHAYSHRYVIYGRLVDANGDPVPGVTLDMRADPRFFRPESACRDETGSDLTTEAYGPTYYRPTTDAHGDFIFCYHTHQINRVEPGEGDIAVTDSRIAAAMGSVPAVHVRFDPEFRQQFVLIRLPQAYNGSAPAVVASSYTVLGRLWTEGGINGETVEGIKVLGDTVQRADIDITIKDGSGNVVATDKARSNDYGDFAVRVPVSGRVENGTVEIVTKGQTFTAPAVREGVTSFQARVAPEASETLRTALIVGGALLGLGAVIGGGYYAIRKFTENRELDEARRTTTRKRSNK